jgi:hypothetical protein
LPARKHFVQTLMCFTVPPSLTLTDWMFTFHLRRVWRLEWETLFPDACPFPQIAHFLDMMLLPSLLCSYVFSTAVSGRSLQMQLE